MAHFYLTTIFFLCIGLYMLWRGRVAVRDKFMANSLKSRLVTGITHVEGKHAVLAGKFFIVFGSIVTVGAVLVLMGGIIFSATDFLKRRSRKLERNRMAKKVSDVPANTANNSSSRPNESHSIPGDRSFNSPNRGSSSQSEPDEDRIANQIAEDMAEVDKELEKPTRTGNDPFGDGIDPAITDQARELMEAAAESVDQDGELAHEKLAEIGERIMDSVNQPNTESSPNTNSAVKPEVDSETDSESQTISLGVPEIALPILSYDKEQAIKSHSVGFGLAKDEVIDAPPEGGVIVGFIICEGGIAKEIVSLQPVYQCGDEYVTGETIGTDDEEGEKSLMIAPPGCVVSGLSVYSAVGIKALRLGFMEMDERGRLKKNTAEFSEWKGDTGSGREEFIDGKGKAIVGVYGLFRHGKDLAAMGLFAAKRVKVVETAADTNGETKIRNWQSADGKFSVKAEYLETKDDRVKLRNEKGSEIWVDIDKLSDDDQAWLKERS